MSVHRPPDIQLPGNLKKQDPQGLGKQLVYGVAEIAVATTMAAAAAIEGSAAVCSHFTLPNGQNTTAPAQGFCSTAETLSQGTWIPTSYYGLVPYVGAAAALGADGVRRIYNVTKVGLQGVKEDGKKAWKIFKDKATSMNKKYPAMAAGLVAGFFTSGLTVATAALGCGAYVAADLYNDYIAEPGVKKKEPSGFSAPSLVVDESDDSEEDEALIPIRESAWVASSSYQADDGAEELYAVPPSLPQRRALRTHFPSVSFSAPSLSFFDAETPATAKIRVKIQSRTYTFSNIRAAFYAHRYPSQAAQFVGKNAQQAETLASSLSDDVQDPHWREKNLQTMYFVVGLRLRSDPAARAELRAMSDAQIDQLNTDFNGISPILKRIREWDKRRSTPVDDSYPRQVAALARRPDAL